MRKEQWTIKAPVSGEVLGTFIVEAEPIQDAAPAPAGPLPAPNGRQAAPNGQGGGEKMTEPQKRYLFRILGAQGLQPKAIEAHIKQYFRVASLADVPRAAASAYIDQLVKDQKEAKGGGA